jgi:hypothetical protein
MTSDMKLRVRVRQVRDSRCRGEVMATSIVSRKYNTSDCLPVAKGSELLNKELHTAAGRRPHSLLISRRDFDRSRSRIPMAGPSPPSALLTTPPNGSRVLAPVHCTTTSPLLK